MQQFLRELSDFTGVKLKLHVLLLSLWRLFFDSHCFNLHDVVHSGVNLNSQLLN